MRLHLAPEVAEVEGFRKDPVVAKVLRRRFGPRPRTPAPFGAPPLLLAFWSRLKCDNSSICERSNGIGSEVSALDLLVFPGEDVRQTRTPDDGTRFHSPRPVGA